MFAIKLRCVGEPGATALDGVNAAMRADVEIVVVAVAVVGDANVEPLDDFVGVAPVPTPAVAVAAPAASAAAVVVDVAPVDKLETSLGGDMTTAAEGETALTAAKAATAVRAAIMPLSIGCRYIDGTKPVVAASPIGSAPVTRSTRRTNAKPLGAVDDALGSCAQHCTQAKHAQQTDVHTARVRRGRRGGKRRHSSRHQHE